MMEVLGRLVKRTEEMRELVASIGKDMRGERWSDVVLYSREAIPLPVHRLVLSQSPYLARLLTSLSCCQGRCSNQEPISVLLPGISYLHLLKVVTFLYTGRLQCTVPDRQHLLVSTVISPAITASKVV